MQKLIKDFVKSFDYNFSCYEKSQNRVTIFKFDSSHDQLYDESKDVVLSKITSSEKKIGSGAENKFSNFEVKSDPELKQKWNDIMFFKVPRKKTLKSGDQNQININTYNENNKHRLPLCITNNQTDQDNNMKNYSELNDILKIYTANQFVDVSINIINDASKYGALPAPRNSSGELDSYKNSSENPTQTEYTNIIMNNKRLYNVMNIQYNDSEEHRSFFTNLVWQLTLVNVYFSNHPDKDNSIDTFLKAIQNPQDEYTMMIRFFMSIDFIIEEKEILFKFKLFNESFVKKNMYTDIEEFIIPNIVNGTPIIFEVSQTMCLSYLKIKDISISNSGRGSKSKTKLTSKSIYTECDNFIESISDTNMSKEQMHKYAVQILKFLGDSSHIVERRINTLINEYTKNTYSINLNDAIYNPNPTNPNDGQRVKTFYNNCKPNNIPIELITTGDQLVFLRSIKNARDNEYVIINSVIGFKNHVNYIENDPKNEYRVFAIYGKKKETLQTLRIKFSNLLNTFIKLRNELQIYSNDGNFIELNPYLKIKIDAMTDYVNELNNTKINLDKAVSINDSNIQILTNQYTTKCTEYEEVFKYKKEYEYVLHFGKYKTWVSNLNNLITLCVYKAIRPPIYKWLDKISSTNKQNKEEYLFNIYNGIEYDRLIQLYEFSMYFNDMSSVFGNMYKQIFQKYFNYFYENIFILANYYQEISSDIKGYEHKLNNLFEKDRNKLYNDIFMRMKAIADNISNSYTPNIQVKYIIDIYRYERDNDITIFNNTVYDLYGRIVNQQNPNNDAIIVSQKFIKYILNHDLFKIFSEINNIDHIQFLYNVLYGIKLDAEILIMINKILTKCIAHNISNKISMFSNIINTSSIKACFDYISNTPATPQEKGNDISLLISYDSPFYYIYGNNSNEIKQIIIHINSLAGKIQKKYYYKYYKSYEKIFNTQQPTQSGGFDSIESIISFENYVKSLINNNDDYNRLDSYLTQIRRYVTLRPSRERQIQIENQKIEIASFIRCAYLDASLEIKIYGKMLLYLYIIKNIFDENPDIISLKKLILDIILNDITELHRDVNSSKIIIDNIDYFYSLLYMISSMITHIPDIYKTISTRIFESTNLNDEMIVLKEYTEEYNNIHSDKVSSTSGKKIYGKVTKTRGHSHKQRQKMYGGNIAAVKKIKTKNNTLRNIKRKNKKTIKKKIDLK